VSRGLPKPGSFVSLLDGGWSHAGWRVVPASIDTSATVELPADIVAPLAFRSAAASDVGLVRELNEDAFLERPETGIWVVADGLGGHREGEVASRMVCDALAELLPDPTFEGTIYAVRQRLRAVNEYLLHTGTKAALSDRSASTVVVLLARGATCAVLWAGDSRVYRWRQGSLELLTRDHALVGVDGGSERELANAITRAVGVQAELTLDVLRDSVVPGDRFLLCSDGLTRQVPDVQIQELLAQEDLGAAVSGLISATLAAGAPDNVTVLVAEAYADRA
jgi:serine/threonine protein phosphatase PrpC